jgi:hypothetical protein
LVAQDWKAVICTRVLVLCTLAVRDTFEKNIFTVLKMKERNRARVKMK